MPQSTPSSPGGHGAKERKRQHRWEQKNRWMPHYELKYGVQPVEFGPNAIGAAPDSNAPAVVRAKCRFCESFGREPPTSAKAEAQSTQPQPQALKRRKKRQTLKLFGPNFRTDNLESHLSREHPVRWKAYERLRDADKKIFFPSESSSHASGVTAAANAANEAAFAAASMAMQSHSSDSNGQVGISMTPSSGTGGHTSVPGLSSTLDGVGSNAVAQGNNNKLLNTIAATWSPMISASSVSPAVASANTGLKVAVPGAVLELLDHLLGLRAPDATWQPFVRPEAVPTELVAPGQSSGASTSRAGGSRETQHADEDKRPEAETETVMLGSGSGLVLLEVPSEPLLLFCADAFRVGLDVDSTLALLHASQHLQPLLDPAVVLNHGAPVARSSVVLAVRQVAALNLGALASLLACTWGFSLSLRFCGVEDGVNATAADFLDVRMQIPVHDELQDLHVLALPLSVDRLHSSESAILGTAVARAISAVDPRAMEKLVGITVDGDPYKVGAMGFEVAKWLQTQAQVASTASSAGNSRAAAFWVRPSGAFALSLAVEDALAACQREFAFLSSLAGVEALCKAHRELRELLVGVEFPLALSGHHPRRGGAGAASASLSSSSSPLPPMRTHWLEVAACCEWLAMHRETIVKWQRDRNDVDALLLTPPPKGNLFWVLVFLLRDLLKDVQAAHDRFASGPQALSFADVQRHLRELVLQLRLKFNIKASTTGASSVSNTSASTVETSLEHLNGESGANDLSFTYQDFVNAVIPLDLFMYEAFQLKTVDGMGEHERTVAFEKFRALLLTLLGNLLTVAAVTTETSATAASTPATDMGSPSRWMTFTDLGLERAVVPPSTPYELAMLSNLAFMELLNGQQARLRAKWSGKVLAQITDDRNRLVAEFAQRGALYEAIVATAKQQASAGASGEAASNFREAWRPVALEFPSLCSFAAVFGGLLAVPKVPAPGEVLPKSAAASNVILEAQLHSQQLARLTALRKQLDTIV